MSSEEKQIIKSEEVGSLEEALGPNDPLFQPEPEENKDLTKVDFGKLELQAIAAKLADSRAEGYLEGYKAALRMYAHWMDGVQYVGSCGKTLQQALIDIAAELRR